MDKIPVLSSIYRQLYDGRTIGLKSTMFNYESLIESILKRQEEIKVDLDDQLSKFLLKLSSQNLNSIDDSYEVFNMMTKDFAEMSLVLFTERKFFSKKQLCIIFNLLIAKDLNFKSLI